MSPLNKILGNTLYETEAKIFMVLFLSALFNRTEPKEFSDLGVDASEGIDKITLRMPKKFTRFLEKVKQDTLKCYMEARNLDKLDNQDEVRENFNSTADVWVKAMLSQALIDGIIHAVAINCGQGKEAVLNILTKLHEQSQSAKELLNELKE